MKSLYISISILLLLLTGLNLQAQNDQFQIGITGGLNLSSLSIAQPDVPNSRLLPGGYIGISTTYNISNRISLQSGLSLTAKGGIISGDSSIGFPFVRPANRFRKNILKSRQTYLQLPIYALYRININNEIKVLINAGPYFAYGIIGTTRLNANILHGDAIYEDEFKEKTFAARGLKKFDFGLGAGVGIELKEVVLGVNYEYGTKNIGPKGEVYYPFYNTGYKNRNILLSLQYKIRRK